MTARVPDLPEEINMAKMDKQRRVAITVEWIIRNAEETLHLLGSFLFTDEDLEELLKEAITAKDAAAKMNMIADAVAQEYQTDMINDLEIENSV